MKLGSDMAAPASATRAGPSPGRSAAPVQGQESAAGEDKVTLSVLGQRAAEQLAQVAELARAAMAEGRPAIEAYQRATIANVYSSAEFARVVAPTLARDDAYFARQASRDAAQNGPAPQPVVDASQDAAPDSAAGQPEPAEAPRAAESLSSLEARRAWYEARLDPELAKTGPWLTGE